MNESGRLYGYIISDPRLEESLVVPIHKVHVAFLHSSAQKHPVGVPHQFQELVLLERLNIPIFIGKSYEDVCNT